MLASLTDFAAAQSAANLKFKWNELSPIPDPVGFAGSFAGVSHGALLVAGGANFPDGGAPWTGSVKKWHDKIFVLESPEGSWKEIGKLPSPLGYGVSVSWNNTFILVGGSNEAGHTAAVLAIEYKNGKLNLQTLPSLPKPIANLSGALVGDVIYVAGGLDAPDSKSTSSSFFRLDLSQKGAEQKWQELETWPGPSRMLSVAGTSGNDFYLFSGTQLVDGKREYLKDAYKYSPATGWFKIKDLPHAVVAAPGPAFTTSNGNLLIFGGDDGKYAATASELKEKHPGFVTEILKYDTTINSWQIVGSVLTNNKADAPSNPNGSIWAPVTTTAVVWKGGMVFPGGEVRPAIRTPRVLQVKLLVDRD